MEKPPQRELRLYSIFTGIFVASLILVAPLGSKFVLIGPFVVSAASLTFPINFIFNDLLTEVYGFARSRRIIWTGMGCQLFAAFMFFIVGLWPAPEFWQNQEAYMTILGAVPRITVASIVAYFFSEFTNSYIVSRMKHRHQGKRGKYQAWRFVASTAAGEAVDSIIFISIAFGGTIALTNLLQTILGIWVFKVVFEIVLLPFTTRFANFVKKIEGVDKIDYPEHTNYNPFATFFSKKNLSEKYQ